MNIPVICDRCRSTGIAGEADFSHLGDLLEFTPVPRKTQRADGWSPEKQRAFIAALSATGSKRQAALAIGMATYGVDRMLEAEANDSFKAAFERAMAIAKQNGSMKIARGVADAAARNAAMAEPSRLRDYQPEDESTITEDEKWYVLERIGVRFMKKVAQEREARLAGEIVAADFYLRQITVMEVGIDLMSTEFSFEVQEVWRNLRRGDHHLRDIASTWISDEMDRARRDWWAQEGEPERPPYPDTRFLKRQRSADGDYATSEDMYACDGMRPPPGVSQEEWDEMSRAEQHAMIERVKADDAEAQREWEVRAREAWEASRAQRSG
jgi:hypothetical protein